MAIVPDPPRPPLERPLRAAAWMTGAVASFSSMAVAGRVVSDQLDTFEIMTYRSAGGLIVVLAVAAWAGGLRQISTARLGLHLARNAFHFAGQNLWFLAITLIPLAQVFALEFSYPIMVAVLAPLLLGEPRSRSRLLAAGAGFLGILIIVRPGLETLSLGTLCALLAAMGFAATAIATKVLTRTQWITTILFWLTSMQLGMGLLTAGYDGDIARPDAAAAPWVLLIALAGLAAHYCLTMALSEASAAVVTPMDFARLPVIAVVGALVYGEALDPFVFLGGAVILAANWVNLRRPADHGKSAPSPHMTD